MAHARTPGFAPVASSARARAIARARRRARADTAPRGAQFIRRRRLRRRQANAPARDLEEPHEGRPELRIGVRLPLLRAAGGRRFFRAVGPFHLAERTASPRSRSRAARARRAHAHGRRAQHVPAIFLLSPRRAASLGIHAGLPREQRGECGFAVGGSEFVAQLPRDLHRVPARDRRRLRRPPFARPLGRHLRDPVEAHKIFHRGKWRARFRLLARSRRPHRNPKTAARLRAKPARLRRLLPVFAGHQSSREPPDLRAQRLCGQRHAHHALGRGSDRAFQKIPARRDRAQRLEYQRHRRLAL